MLDTQTKQLINSARDILVGKVPDPKSQIEQITLALIYKFMDDMDRETVEKLKGKPKFFAGDFAKYSWRNIFNPTLGGHEMLALYAEALEKMNTNPGIHPFFREIFKNAFLPYRSPETLKLFLKTIHEFNYDHSENLGNAYEFLLSILGTQGDAGQFRTPRHIIEFIVKVIDPQRHETILDPACGTAGFLLAAYKHILAQNTSGNSPGGDGPLCPSDISPKGARVANQRGVNGDLLTPDDRKLLATNLTGYDIDPNMERFALVNMFLHGFVTPQIHEYDTLSSQDRWNEYYDVILANPPFMSPKGGIRPHNRFSVKSNRSEVLFVDYIAEHLAAGGRAGVIVPEGIIFQSGTAYKSLRKMLVEENYLVGVISLPAGVFNPYSGVKTSILWLDKTFAKNTDKILFVKIDSDGFDLGAQRRIIKENDLIDALININAYKQTVQRHEEFKVESLQNITLVKKAIVAENRDYNLSAERYFIQKIISNHYELVGLHEIFTEITNGINVQQFDEPGKYIVTRIQTIADGTVNLKNTKWTNDEVPQGRLMQSGDILFSHINSIDHLAKTAIFKNYSDLKVIHGINLLRLRPDKTRIIPEFAIRIFKSDLFIEKAKAFAQRAVNQASIRSSDIKAIQIPLPPLSIQQELVSEIESYQKIIDGARQVVENYKPRIEVDPGWEMVELGEVTKIISGFGFDSSDFKTGNTVPSIKITNVGVGSFVETNSDFLPKEFQTKYTNYLANTGDVAIALTRPYIAEGLKVCKVPLSYHDSLVNQRVAILKKTEKANLDYVYFYLFSDIALNFIKDKARSLNQPNLSVKDLYKFPLPLPDLSTQRRIVEQIEREQALVRAGKELIGLFEMKIRARVKGVWGDRYK